MPDTYDIDLGDGNVISVESEGPLSDDDVKKIVHELGAASKPDNALYAAGSVQVGAGGPRFERGDVNQRPPFKTVSKWRQDTIKDLPAPRLGDSQDDLGQSALAGMGGSADGLSPQIKRWADSAARQALMAPALGVELADIGQSAFENLRDGVPLMSMNPQSPGARLRDVAIGAVPLLSEGRAAFTGTPKNPGGGLPAAWEVLGESWEADPVGTALQFVAARQLMKAPPLRSLNEGMKALETSADLSAPGRQGALLSVNHPKAVPGALRDMVTSARSPNGLDAVAARAARPAGSVPAPPLGVPLSSMTVANPGPVPAGGAPLAPAPSQTPRMASSVSRSGMTEVSPGVYRMPSEVLDEALQVPTSAAGALKRATAPDLLPVVQGPESATITTRPLTGTFPDGTPRSGKQAGGAPVASSVAGPSPEAFGLAVKPGNSEQFRGKWAKEIPLIGPLVSASERGFDGYLISIRRAAFDSAAEKLAAKGITPESSPQTYRDLATWVNRASGVGSSSIPPVIADAMFAPRLTASRLELLNPLAYEKLTPEVRKLAMRQVAVATGAGLSVLALAKASGATVSLDPESPDFGKVLLKDGKTRYEVFAGMTPYARLAAMALFGSPKTGKQAGKRLESMLGPLPSLAVGALRGSTFTGEDFDPLSETGRRFVPLVAQDMADAIRELGGVEGVLKASPALLGGGVQVYGKKGGR